MWRGTWKLSSAGPGPRAGFRRCLHLHEYQSKELMNSFGINTQRFVVASAPEEAREKARQLGTR